MDETNASADSKPCRHCGEAIKPSANVCRYCNREQSEPQGERILYDGPGHLPFMQLVWDLALCVVCIGVFLLLRDIVNHRSRRYRVTSQQVVMESGIFNKRVDLLDLFRIQDMQYQSRWGVGTIVLTSSDKSTPKLSLPIPNARPVFEELRSAIAAARKAANVSVQERL